MYLSIQTRAEATTRSSMSLKMSASSALLLKALPLNAGCRKKEHILPKDATNQGKVYSESTNAGDFEDSGGWAALAALCKMITAQL